MVGRADRRRVAGLFAYELAREHSESGYRAAYANGARIVEFERALGLFIEDNVQRFVLSNDPLTHLFNGVYAYLYWPVVLGVLLWLFLVDKGNYRLYRNCLGISAALAIVTIYFAPVAPPRMVPEARVIDTFLFVGSEQEFANQYAAVPSLHVGWLFLSGYVFARSVGWRRGMAISAVPGTAMLVTVMATGNHFWVDGAIGTFYALGPAVLFAEVLPRLARPPEAQREPVAAAGR